MIRTKYTCLTLFLSFLLLSNTVFAQQDSLQYNADKIIISGKTYYLHQVAKGEGFYGISKKYGVSQKEIHEANPNAIFGLKPGDILKIPVISGRNSSITEIQKSNEFIYHTIEKGQTLYFLSKKYDVSIEDIKKYNVGADQNLLVGTIFKIPLNTVKANKNKEKDFRYHVVQRKETLYGISRKYDVTVDTIITCNPALENGILSIGSTIRIPIVQVASDIKVKEVAGLKLEDNSYIYHKIKVGETIYSISKQYNISQDAIFQTNPDLNQNELLLGYVVRIPKDKIKKSIQRKNQQSDFVTHVVRRRETLYSISNKYKITIKDLEEANPTLILSNLRKGMKLKIPTESYLQRIQLDKEREEDVKNNIDTNEYQDTIKIDCGEYNYADYNETIKVAVLLPFNIEATQKANVIKKIVDDEEVKIKREEEIISSRSRTFVEFYEGALLAIDSLKKQGVNIHLFTYDTAPDTNKVKQILAAPELKMVDFIIGPAYASNLPLVSDFSIKHQIKMIYPLSSVNPTLNENPYLFQVNTPDSLLYRKYAQHIVQNHNQSRVVLIKSSNPDRDEEKLSLEIKNQLYLKYLSLEENPDYVEVSFSEQDVQGIEALLNKEKLNLVVIPSPDEADVSKIVTTLHGVSETTGINIKLIGFSGWLKYQTINPEEIHELNTEILTSYALDYKNSESNTLINKFRKTYFTEPFAVSPYFIRSGKNSKYSRYGIWGFDVMYYFVKARVDFGNQFEHCISECNTNQVQFNFEFKRSENWGGFYNEGAYVLSFSPSLEIFRRPLK